MIEARIVLGLCDRFMCRPSQARREDASVLRMLELERAWKAEEGGEED